MPFIRTFENFAPPRREDGIPFVEVEVRENAVETFNTSTTIDTFPLDPPDLDPTQPVARSFTTANALIQKDGWYWLVWRDANSAEFISDGFQQSVTLTILERQVRSEFPQTWDGLMRESSLGIETLRMRVHAVKATALPVIYANQPDAQLPEILRAYLAKKIALDLIPTAIEYWMRQKVSLSATGTNENKEFPDPIGAMRELANRLTREVQNLAANPDVLQYSRPNNALPAVSFGGDLITPNPFEFEPMFESDLTFGETP